MNLEIFTKLIRITVQTVSDIISRGSYNILLIRNQDLRAQYRHILVTAQHLFPDYEEYFKSLLKETSETTFTIKEVNSSLKYILEIIMIEEKSEEKIRERKFFESADEKLKQAGLSFEKSDFSSTYHNLNTSLELVLKEKLRIPVTISKINTSRIIDVLVKYRVEPYLFLSEAKKHIVMIDNKMKH